jgi:multicomponent Na+:H+ antiporter subunit E
MTALLFLLLLAGLWVVLTGDTSLANAVAGLVLGAGLLWWFDRGTGERVRFRRIPARVVLHKIPAMIVFLLFLIWELVISSLRIVLDVVTPGPKRDPAFVVVPLEVERDVEIALLANLVSLTPGTLALDVSKDRREMLVHAMFAADPEALRRQIKDGYERRVKELLS